MIVASGAVSFGVDANGKFGIVGDLSPVRVAVLLCASGCGFVSDAPSVVGSWDVTRISSQTVGALSLSQDALDLSRPLQGQILIGEPVNETLPVYGGYRYGVDLTEVYLANSPVDQPAQPWRYQLSVRTIRGEVSVLLWANHGIEGSRTFTAAEASTRVVRDGPRLTLDLDLPLHGGTETAHVAGTVVLGHRAIEAGDRSVLFDEESDVTGMRYVFEPGGVLRTQHGTPVNREEVGRWSPRGDRLTLEWTQTRDSRSRTYQVSADDEGLSLTESCPDPSGCTEDCLRNAEREFGLRTGTLSSLNYKTTTRLRAAPGSRP